MSLLTVPRRLRWFACLAGLALALAITGCGSVGSKPDGASGTGGTTSNDGSGGAPGAGGSGDGSAGAPGDGSVDRITPPPDSGGTGGSSGAGGSGGNSGARWDVSNWDNAQWG